MTQSEHTPSQQAAEQAEWQRQVAARNQKVGKVATGVIVGMFLFGFASIPLYRWVCAQVNPGGSSWFNGDPDDYSGVVADTSRTLNIRFTTNVERVLPWEFYSMEQRVTIHPGEKKLVNFVSKNLENYPIKGKAVYDINPPEAGRHYRKIECFCFIEQTLGGGEQVDMPLYFWFDPEIPEHVKEISLAYTFFSAESSMARSLRNQATRTR